jgi:replicative DNA helicase
MKLMQKNNNLPIDNDFFESVIAYNALTNEMYLTAIIDTVKPNYFKDDNIREVVGVITKYFQKYNKIPTTTELKTHLVTDTQKNAFKKVVKGFSLLDSKYNLDALFENTEKFFKEKAVYNAILETANKYSKESNIDTSDTLSVFEQACSISLVDDMGMDYLNEIDRHIEQIKKVDKRLSSGWRWLDEKIGGGFLADGRAMYTFCGVTNSGKSIILGNLATNIITQNKVVPVISLEMSEDIYCQRIDGQLTRIPIENLKNEVDNLKTFVNNFRATHKNAKLFVKEYPPKGVTVNHIKAYLQKLLLKKNIKRFDAIIVDYVNLIRPSIPTGNSYTDVKAVTEQLRALSYLFKCPVITVTQLGRTAFDELNPGLETTSESIGLSMTTDFQASIWSNDEDKELGIIHMGIQKNRFGINYGSHAFKIDYKTLAIDEIDEDFTESNEVVEMENQLDKLLK